MMMRRVGFYGMIIAQVVLIVILAWQFQSSLSKGREVTLMTKPDDSEEMYAYDLIDDYYAQFDINYIPEKQMDGKPSQNDSIYVLLTKKEGAYEVKQASTTIDTPNKNEMMLQGTYMYHDNDEKAYYVEYGFEHVKNIDKYGDFTNQDKLKVTLNYVEKWNQYEMMDMEQVE